VDLVTSIELVEDLPQNPGKLVSARVHFETGQHQDFTAPDAVQELASWLRAHRAP
jgi:hypothetical protein